ncbi:rhomboid family intramembrane serine protease [Bacillus salitolerans]|uniref:Rhomboid family intramembrane serine protease n=1 Tax=Bacillus salitolerans TaxID=1437434 RepID=A0ABW4LN01_9BACI
MKEFLDSVYWQLIYKLVVKEKYHLVALSESQNEMWLQSTNKKNQAKLIRILRYDLDWGNWMRRDMENVIKRLDFYRKKHHLHKLEAVNIYVSSYPPVDEYVDQLSKPLSLKRSSLHTYLITSENAQNDVREVEAKLTIPLEINLKDDYVNDQTIQVLKSEVLVTATERVKGLKALFQAGKPRWTYVFMVIQLLMFLLLERFGGSTDPRTLIQFGAKYTPLILEGEWWRFFTPIFLHIGFLHLFMNTIALLYLGRLIEQIYGNYRFVYIYLFSGILGSIASFVFSPSLSAGASGAIFGCFGALVYFGMINPKVFLQTMGSNVIVLIGINVVIGFLVPSIDNSGHLGGLLGGFLAAGAVSLPSRKNFVSQAAFIIATIIILFVLLIKGYGVI